MISTDKIVDELVLDNIKTMNLLREDMKAALNRNADLLDKILNKEGFALIPLNFVYPDAGAVTTIDEGTLTLNYETGSITSVAGVSSEMDYSLDSHGKDYVRSLSIWVDKPVIIDLDSKVKYPVKYGRWFNLSYHQFKTLKITTTGTTKVFVIASTNVETPLTERSALDEYLTEKVNTTTILGATAKYAGSSFETQGFSKLVGFAIADKDGRLEVQQSQSDFIEDIISEFDLDIAKVALDYCQVWDDTAEAFVNETSTINSAAASDVELELAANKDSIIYFGGYVRFNKINFTIGVAGAYVGSITWEYYNGTAWVDLSTAHNLSDGTTAFKVAAGADKLVTFDMPTDWAENEINSVTMYWIRARSALTGFTTDAEITQAWLYPLVEIPFSIDVLGKYAKLVYYNEGTAQTYFRAVCNLKNLK